MTQANVELRKFWSDYLPAHEEVERRLGGISDPAEFARALVDEGSKAGFRFAEADVAFVLASHGERRGELDEAQLDQVAGGRKAGKGQQEYLIVTMKEVFITG